MKHSLIALLTIFAATLAYAQKSVEKAVPAAVKSGLQKSFPHAKEVEWEKEDRTFEAEFKLKKKEYSARFDEMGNLLETEEEIPAEDLPKPALEYASSHFSGKKIKETARITDAKGVVTFEIEVAEKDLLFDSKGDFISEKVNQED